MVDKNGDRKLYKIPTNDILDNRREFYGLKRKAGETIEKWLNRVYSHIEECDFPKSVEYILTDKFICELNATERELIRKADINWSVKCEFVSIVKKNCCSAFRFFYPKN